MVILGGWEYLMSEAPLKRKPLHKRPISKAKHYPLIGRGVMFHPQKVPYVHVLSAGLVGLALRFTVCAHTRFAPLSRACIRPEIHVGA